MISMGKIKYNKKLVTSIIIIFGLNFISACSKNLTPPEGMIIGQTVGENASSSGFTNQMPDKKSLSSGTVPFSGSEKEVVGSAIKVTDVERDARLSDLEFKSTNDLQDIYFQFDQYDLDDTSREILTKNASFLKTKNPAAKIEIQGHCDERGTNNYNISLAEHRVQSTKAYLVSLGVDPKRIHTISFGEDKPLCFDRNETCWSKNRRAHFRISG
jgi:peptidoglycan-associated lipoprotein|tara:strand:- start:343 stop:984 length:642 start_codon:yes stop_codon:yes gene_type:complete